ncbi:MAG: ribosomal RNA small subunit methyltransferase A [Candidatus Magasanikbacteria bacterium RIFOXYD1_FULL_40_23]|uniref:Ribosomal RNA small subunit methyltransferase A n=1 Tax=Candidatus Magasanikbacteria bacterium RIFOXYD1_FULL_40_23 TaxID=1798705 RepID=A0A1F6P9G2_9BACT|nr:MAG: ribosomal RNA small subunit methyltransferase A [Candidatus Magasanikbacteria bacterium RIFOXYD1_FULL_40_23]
MYMSQKLFNEDYLKHLCQKYSLTPSKKYGQNYLVNPEPIEKMVNAAEIKKDDVVVEVGPGFGVLTLALAEKAKKVISFEIEKKLTTYWKNITGHPERSEGSLLANERDSSAEPQNDKYKNIEIVWGNILYEFKGDGLKAGEYKVVANLPYQITSHVIRKFLEMENNPDMLVLMVQKEVAERICAQAGDMSVLAVSVQYYGKPEIVTFVPRSSFWPMPAVDSAVIKIKINKDNAGAKNNSESFFKLVKAGFSSRRKMLIKNLSAVADRQALRNLFKELGIDEKVRAQELSVEQWKEIVAKLSF